MQDIGSNITFHFKTEEENLINLTKDYWLKDQNNKWFFTYKSLLQKYSSFGKSRQTLERLIESAADIYLEVTCSKCQELKKIQINNRDDLKYADSEYRNFECKACQLEKIEYNRYLKAKNTEEYNLLKTKSIRFLADKFNEGVIGSLTQKEIQILEIISKHQDENSQNDLYKTLVKEGFVFDDNFWKTINKLQSNNLIEMIKKSTKGKRLCFIHPETLNIIRGPKNDFVNVELTPLKKRDISDPDFTGTLIIKNEMQHKVGEELSLSLELSPLRITFSISNRKRRAIRIGHIIKNNSQKKHEPCKHPNFFHASLPIRISKSDPEVKTLNFIHILSSPIHLNKLSRLRMGLWIRDNNVKIKIEPSDLPFLHGKSEFLE